MNHGAPFEDRDSQGWRDAVRDVTRSTVAEAEVEPSSGDSNESWWPKRRSKKVNLNDVGPSESVRAKDPWVQRECPLSQHR